MDNIIKKIVLNLGNKEITLTSEQAKKLKNALDEMFGKEVIREVHCNDYWRWWPIITSESPKEIPPYEVWCNDCCASYSSDTMTIKI